MSDDLTRLTDEEREALRHAIYNPGFHIRGDSEHHWVVISAAVESILAARTAALIDRAERAERERDKYRKHAETCRFGIELGDLRDGIRQLADEWDDAARDFADQAAEAMSANRATRYYAVASKYQMHAQRVRALLPEEGDNQ